MVYISSNVKNQTEQIIYRTIWPSPPVSSLRDQSRTQVLTPSRVERLLLTLGTIHPVMQEQITAAADLVDSKIHLLPRQALLQLPQEKESVLSIAAYRIESTVFCEYRRLGKPIHGAFIGEKKNVHRPVSWQKHLVQSKTIREKALTISPKQVRFPY